jgi:hypothetical protein
MSGGAKYGKMIKANKGAMLKLNAKWVEIKQLR